MPPNLSDDEIHSLIAYARYNLAAEPYPFAPALRPNSGGAGQARR